MQAARRLSGAVQNKYAPATDIVASGVAMMLMASTGDAPAQDNMMPTLTDGLHHIINSEVAKGYAQGR